MSYKRQNPNNFTLDEIKTATLIVTEGTASCIATHRGKYHYPYIQIAMCDREALEPASRVFGRKIILAKSKRVRCPPELVPPDGKGNWVVKIYGKSADNIMKRLAPHLTKHTLEKWEQTKKKCPI